MSFCHPNTRIQLLSSFLAINHAPNDSKFSYLANQPKFHTNNDKSTRQSKETAFTVFETMPQWRIRQKRWILIEIQSELLGVPGREASVLWKESRAGHCFWFQNEDFCRCCIEWHVSATSSRPRRVRLCFPSFFFY